ncbi:MAG: hypothetical protein PHQ96_07090 [Candidatus Omnitrophica bacterium]|nr:hypothetical protein [Candidatus Omnitrophota bacterium]
MALRKVFFLSFLLFTTCGMVFAASLESRHFDVTLEGGVEKSDVLRKIRLKMFRHLSAMSMDDSGGVEEMLKDTLDEIYMEVQDTLDIRLESLRVKLIIVPDMAAISDVIESYYGRTTRTPSFYIFERNTLYIAESELNAGMLAHEIAHALISNYFPVPPPTKIQEILSGYAEYSVKKNS